MKINGLLSSSAKDEINEDSENDYIERDGQDYHMNNEDKVIGYKATKQNNIQKTYSWDKTVAVADDENAKNAVNELILKYDDGWRCRECRKTCSTKSQMGLHVEIHIDGLSFPCNFCSESFTLRNALAKHKHNKHPKMRF